MFKKRTARAKEKLAMAAIRAGGTGPIPVGPAAAARAGWSEGKIQIAYAAGTKVQEGPVAR
jgi:hypothetical protein